MDYAAGDKALRQVTHRTVHESAALLDSGKFNVVIAKTMELVNATRKTIDSGAGAADPAVREAATVTAQLLSMFAPYTAEDMWEALGYAPSVVTSAWPEVDESLLVDDTITAVVQIKGKVRARLEVPVDITEEQLRAQALAHESVIRMLDGKEPLKVIVRAPKLVNVVPAP